MEAYGRIDIVVNNAGNLTPEVCSELTLESKQRTIKINLTGVFSVMKAVWPVFIEQKDGRCIMTSSPAMYGAGVAAYAASINDNTLSIIDICMAIFATACQPWFICNQRIP